MQLRDPAARGARGVQSHSPRKKEGAGNAGCALHPRSRVQKSGETHTSIQGSGEHPTFPAQWFYGLCRALPGDEFLFASVAGGLKDCSDPVGSTLLRRLDTSNGCRDHTVLPYAAVPRLRLEASPGTPASHSGSSGDWRRSSRALRSLTDDKPALRPRHAPDAAASTATRPSFATMANAPLSGTGWARGVLVIWGRRQGKFLQIGNFVTKEQTPGFGQPDRSALCWS